MKVECPRCQTHVEKPEGGDPVCPTCGFGAPAGTPPPKAPAAGVAPGIAGTEPRMAPALDSSPSGAWDTEKAWANNPSQPKTGMALAAMILGIVGFLTGFLFFGIGLDIAAIILGAVALSKAKNQPEMYGGKGFALAGIIVGSIGLLFMIIAIAAFPALLSLAEQACEDDPTLEGCEDIQNPVQEMGWHVAAAVPMVGFAAATWQRFRHG